VFSEFSLPLMVMWLRMGFLEALNLVRYTTLARESLTLEELVVVAKHPSSIQHMWGSVKKLGQYDQVVMSSERIRGIAPD